MPPKIAFLFLTIDDVNWDVFWNTYLDPERSTIYVHPKNSKDVDLRWMRANIIKKQVPTAWGHIVGAYFELMSAAMEDPDNFKFITISESCIPIKPFDELYADMIASPETSIIKTMPIKKYDQVERINKQPGHKKYKFTKHYARFCLARQHVAKLMAVPNEQRKFFEDMHVGDEFFLSLILPMKNVENRAITFDNWDAVQREIKKINDKMKKIYNTVPESPARDNKLSTLREHKRKIAANPKSYIKVSKSDIREATSTGCYFWRKFPTTSNICVHKSIILQPRPVRVPGVNGAGKRRRKPKAHPPPAKPLFFIHIPKTAGTTIEAVCYKYGECVGSCFMREKRNDVRVISNIHKHISSYHVPLRYFCPGRVAEIFLKYTVFAVVRNPYDRIVSDFKFWNEYYRVRPKEKPENPESLNDINAFVAFGIGTLRFDGHFIPMSEYISGTRADDIHILRFENLSSDFDKLMKLNRTPIPARILKKTHINVSKPRAGEVSVADLSAKSINMINASYADDFDRFNYERM